MTYGTYSFNEVSCVLMGLVQMNNPVTSLELSRDGVAREGIVLEPNDQRSQLMIGADGTVVHALTENRSATLTVNLMKINRLNETLQDMLNLQTSLQMLHGQNIVLLQHHDFRDVIICNEVGFRHPPTINYTHEGGIVTWVFDVGTCIMRLGQRDPVDVVNKPEQNVTVSFVISHYHAGGTLVLTPPATSRTVVLGSTTRLPTGFVRMSGIDIPIQEWVMSPSLAGVGSRFLPNETVQIPQSLTFKAIT